MEKKSRRKEPQLFCSCRLVGTLTSIIYPTWRNPFGGSHWRMCHPGWEGSIDDESARRRRIRGERGDEQEQQQQELRVVSPLREPPSSHFSPPFPRGFALSLSLNHRQLAEPTSSSLSHCLRRETCALRYTTSNNITAAAEAGIVVCTGAREHDQVFRASRYASERVCASESLGGGILMIWTRASPSLRGYWPLNHSQRRGRLTISKNLELLRILRKTKEFREVTQSTMRRGFQSTKKTVEPRNFVGQFCKKLRGFRKIVLSSEQKEQALNKLAEKIVIEKLRYWERRKTCQKRVNLRVVYVQLVQFLTTKYLSRNTTASKYHDSSQKSNLYTNDSLKNLQDQKTKHKE